MESAGTKDGVSCGRRCRDGGGMIYVMTRVYCPDLSVHDRFIGELRRALEIVAQCKVQGDHGLVFLMNDDTNQSQVALYGEYSRKRNAMLNDVFGSDGWQKTESPGGEGSSMAMFRLRKLFVDIGGADDDIAVCLDQDDELRPDALASIVKYMKSGNVGITQFEVIDKDDLDITGDRGQLHNSLARKLCNRRYAGRFLKGKCRKGAADLSSIGWTKVYTRNVLHDYVRDLEELLEGRGGAKEFFGKYTAYEDFLDYYVLLFRDIRLTGIGEKTHNYIKNNESITSTPRIEDFSETRTTMLMTLIDLCYSSKRLCDDFRPKLLRFIASKIFQIEAILEKYRREFVEDGREKYAEFAAKTYVDYFVGAFYSRVQREGGESLRNFEDLMSVTTYRKVPQYKDATKESSPGQILRKTADVEKHLRNQKRCLLRQCRQLVASRMLKVRNWVRVKVLCKGELKGKNLMSGNNTPHQSQYRILLVLTCIVVVLLLTGLGLAVYVFCIKDNPAQFKDYDVAITVAGSIVVSILTLLINETSKIKVVLDNEKSTARLFYSEFDDFTRHLEANVKVMAQILKELKEKGKCQVEDIHFDNLVWPETSCLFSNEMAKLIERDRVDDFSRLKVNIRNVNNSAKWLQRAARAGEDIRAALDWEITRCFGYLVNLYYMKDNDFSFPPQDELERYIHENCVRNKLTTLFLSEPSDVREEMVDYYIGRYYQDRRVKRAVLVTPC